MKNINSVTNRSGLRNITRRENGWEFRKMVEYNAHSKYFGDRNNNPVRSLEAAIRYRDSYSA